MFLCHVGGDSLNSVRQRCREPTIEVHGVPCMPQTCLRGLSKYTWCLTSTETIRLIRDGEKGVWRWGKREIIYLSLHCHHQNDSCIEKGSDESSLSPHFHASFPSFHRENLMVSVDVKHHVYLLTSIPLRLSFSFKKVVVCGHGLVVTLSLTINETLKWLSSLPILMQESVWW